MKGKESNPFLKGNKLFMIVVYTTVVSIYILKKLKP
jgi:hypothetical protein